MKPKRIKAWAVVNKRNGKILSDLLVGQYAIFNNRHEAHIDCPYYCVVHQVEIHVIKTK